MLIHRDKYEREEISQIKYVLMMVASIYAKASLKMISPDLNVFKCQTVILVDTGLIIGMLILIIWFPFQLTKSFQNS